MEDRSAFGCVVAGALCIGFAVVAALCWQAGNADGATVFLAAIPALIGLRILRSFRLGQSTLTIPDLPARRIAL